MECQPTGKEKTMDDMSMYASPDAARTTLAEFNAHIERFNALKLTTAQLAEFAATFAWTYVSHSQDTARAYYHGLMAGTCTSPEIERQADAELRAEALDALAWQALCGPNGSDRQKSASASLARSTNTSVAL